MTEQYEATVVTDGIEASRGDQISGRADRWLAATVADPGQGLPA